jgi:hypothetical protein
VNYSVALEGEPGQALADFLRRVFQGAEPFETDLRKCRQHQTANTLVLLGEAS